jgi:hypothetical protein
MVFLYVFSGTFISDEFVASNFQNKYPMQRNNTLMLKDSEQQATPQWGCFEYTLESTIRYDNPLQDVRLIVELISDTGATHLIEAFWDGGSYWRVRFMPNEAGTWKFETHCSDGGNAGLDKQCGRFECVPTQGGTSFDRHGSIRLSDNRRHFVHADGTPFFWMADTCWNGPLLSTEAEWEHYLSERKRQRFSAVQWVATQWLVSPKGDVNGERSFEGHDQIRVNPTFFQRLDSKLNAINRAGLLGVPVLLWAAEWREPEVNLANPGYSLLEDQAILLARYMVARWGANHVVWILPGDGDYRAEKAERWQRIGREVFGDGLHAPVSLHPFHMQLMLDEFQHEPWLDMIGYQSGHGDDDATLGWLVAGPPATQWELEPARPFINLEPPYENHLGYQSKKPHTDFSVRRAMYWSLLIAPTAGVTYGGHGVWGWDDGSQLPAAHEHTGIPLPWQQGLRMAAAEQTSYLIQLIESIDWWRLMPDQSLVAEQPGVPSQRHRYIAAARTAAGDLAIIYIPQDRTIYLNLSDLVASLTIIWFDPRTGRQITTDGSGPRDRQQYATPAAGDWILLLRSKESRG